MESVETMAALCPVSPLWVPLFIFLCGSSALCSPALPLSWPRGSPLHPPRPPYLQSLLLTCLPFRFTLQHRHSSMSRLHTEWVAPYSPLHTHSLARICPPVPGYSATLASVISTLLRNSGGISVSHPSGGCWQVLECVTWYLWEPTHQGH